MLFTFFKVQEYLSDFYSALISHMVFSISEGSTSEKEAVYREVLKINWFHTNYANFF